MGAASYLEGKRFTRPRKTKEYYSWVETGSVINCDVTPPEEILLDTLMLGLRLADGVSLDALTAQFGEEKVKEIYKCCDPCFEKGWVEVVGGRLKLSDPDGFLFSNVVLAKLFEKLEYEPLEYRTILIFEKAPYIWRDIKSKVVFRINHSNIHFK
jgi:oxygen-independent coproporphyrinogen-3 oxidase